MQKSWSWSRTEGHWHRKRCQKAHQAGVLHCAALQQEQEPSVLWGESVTASTAVWEGSASTTPKPGEGLSKTAGTTLTGTSGTQAGSQCEAATQGEEKEEKKRRDTGKKSEDFAIEAGLHLQKASIYGTTNCFQRLEGSFLPTDGLAVEGIGSFRKKTKHLRMESRADRCHLLEYGQGKRRFVELRRDKLF